MCVLASEGERVCPQSAMGSPCATHVLVANGIDTQTQDSFIERPDVFNFLYKNHTKTLFGLSLNKRGKRRGRNNNNYYRQYFSFSFIGDI